MANDERRYLVRTPSGEEYGPVDQDTLVRWAESGRISGSCEVRSTLLARWDSARNTRFLSEILRAREETQAKKEPGLLGRIKRRATMRAIETRHSSGLNRSRGAEYQTAPLALRLMSGFTDMGVVLILFVLVYLGMALLYAAGIFTGTGAFTVGVALAYILAMMYFAWCLAFRAQTVGQRVWGLLVVRSGDEVIRLGRGFTFAFGVMLFWFLTPFVVYVLPSGRAFQDLLSGVRVVKTRVVGKLR